jgi:hypothetical protein
LSLALQSLWFDAKGDWDKAHELAEKNGGTCGDWVHAYLHRNEGDKASRLHWDPLDVVAANPIYDVLPPRDLMQLILSGAISSRNLGKVPDLTDKAQGI